MRRLSQAGEGLMAAVQGNKSTADFRAGGMYPIPGSKQREPFWIFLAE